MASAITLNNLQIGRVYMLSQHSAFWNLPVNRKLHSDLLKYCICLREGYGTQWILFYFVKTQLSVPALETIQVINNLMEVSCLLLSPLTWSLPPLFPKETLASPPNPHSHRHSSLATQGLPSSPKKRRTGYGRASTSFPIHRAVSWRVRSFGLQQAPGIFIPAQPLGESNRLLWWLGKITIPWKIVL